jgi:hypothetical protein
MWWCMPVIPVTQEVDAQSREFLASSDKGARTVYKKQNGKKGEDDTTVQVVQCFHAKRKVPSAQSLV